MFTHTHIHTHTHTRAHTRTHITHTRVQLAEMHVFEKYNVRVLGTPINTIVTTEDRKLFSKVCITGVCYVYVCVCDTVCVMCV